MKVLGGVSGALKPPVVKLFEELLKIEEEGRKKETNNIYIDIYWIEEIMFT